MCHKASRRLLSCLLVIVIVNVTPCTLYFSHDIKNSLQLLLIRLVLISIPDKHQSLFPRYRYIHAYGPSTHLTFKKQMNLFKTKLLLCRYWQVFSIMTALSCQPVIKSLFSCLRALEGHIYAEKIAQKQSLHKFSNYQDDLAFKL